MIRQLWLALLSCSFHVRHSWPVIYLCVPLEKMQKKHSNYICCNNLDPYIHTGISGLHALQSICRGKQQCYQWSHRSPVWIFNLCQRSLPSPGQTVWLDTGTSPCLCLHCAWLCVRCAHRSSAQRPVLRPSAHRSIFVGALACAGPMRVTGTQAKRKLWAGLFWKKNPPVSSCTMGSVLRTRLPFSLHPLQEPLWRSCTRAADDTHNENVLLGTVACFCVSLSSCGSSFNTVRWLKKVSWPDLAEMIAQIASVSLKRDVE